MSDAIRFDNGPNPLQEALLRRIDVAFCAVFPQATTRERGIFYGQVREALATYDEYRTKRMDELESLVMQHVALRLGGTVVKPHVGDVSGASLLALENAGDTVAGVSFDGPLSHENTAVTDKTTRLAPL